MTPGLAGFIADGSEPQTWDDAVDAALAALAAEFGVVPERTPGEHGRHAAHDLARHVRLAAAQGRA